MQPIADPSIFCRYAHNRYLILKTQFPSLDRRALLLLIADEFWALDAHSWAALVQPGSTSPPTAVGGLAASSNGEDRDVILDAGDSDDDDDDGDGDGDAVLPGVVLRTDYTAGSDEAWALFCGTLRDAEREFLADQEGPGSASASTSAPDDGDDVEMAPAPAAHSLVPAGEESVDDDDDDEGEGGGEEAEKELALFSLVSDSTRLDGISNLRALRLLFDVSVRTAPTPPSSSPLGSAHPRHQHQSKQQQRQDQHRLTCQRGLQEMYDARGRTLWIFDARSRIDGCARLVSEAGDVATGDSWRARATHMAELQASLAARALRIDFGGLDRWDYAERQRNMREASVGCAASLSERN